MVDKLWDSLLGYKVLLSWMLHALEGMKLFKHLRHEFKAEIVGQLFYEWAICGLLLVVVHNYDDARCVEYVGLSIFFLLNLLSLWVLLMSFVWSFWFWSCDVLFVIDMFEGYWWSRQLLKVDLIQVKLLLQNLNNW
jgi:hypothetical protein